MDTSSDSEALSTIEALFSEKNETPFDEDYDPFIGSLSFSRTRLDDREPTELKKAWTNFLVRTFESDTTWEWPCNVGMAEWYVAQEMPLHAIAVYEHLLREVRTRGLDESEGEYCSTFQEWLFRLFHLCQRGGLTEWALHVAELIGDASEDVFFDPAEYAELIASLPALRQSQFSESMEKEREESDRRYREDFGELATKLHLATERCLSRAEFLSSASIRRIDPSPAPLCWSLAIESEFHHKLYLVKRDRLDGILNDKRPKYGQCCGIGQIHMLVEETRDDRRIKEQIPAWGRLLTVRNVAGILKMIKMHRNQIAHVSKSGPYTSAQCDEFLGKVRESGWIIEFLTSLQPSV